LIFLAAENRKKIQREFRFCSHDFARAFALFPGELARVGSDRVPVLDLDDLRMRHAGEEFEREIALAPSGGFRAGYRIADLFSVSGG
jgi:hypothetical protein